MYKRVCAALDQIPDALAKTGFILEHLVAEEFKKAGWSTIGGRYYADDVDGRARELDLVAYRSHKSGELEVVTAVLVSCKKDEETTWTFLTKEKPRHDPNFDWDPVHFWTDSQPLQAYLASESWKGTYIEALGKLYDDSFRASKDIFAFQQVASLKVAPKNDKAIFNSIVSLMKALDHEIEAVPARAKGKNRLYIFSLLSVVDAPMVDVSYAGEMPIATEVDKLTHLARYMVRKRDLSALVHFVRCDRLPQFVDALSKFAKANKKHLESLICASYEAIKSSAKVRNYFADKLKHRLSWRIDSAFRKAGHSLTVDEIELGFDRRGLIILIDILGDDDLAFLNTNTSLRAETAKLLKEIARYEGDFVFEANIPF